MWRLYQRGLSTPPPRAFGTYGRGTVIVPPARIELPEHIHLGRDVRIHENGWLCVRQLPGLPPPRLTIGDNVTIGRFSKIVCTGDLVIEDDALIADHVYIADTHFTYEDVGTPIGKQPLAAPKPVRIGAGSFIGVRAMVQPGVTIGANAYLGAAAVAGEDVPDRTVAVGDPARVVRRYDAATGLWSSTGGAGSDPPGLA